ncbi:hypothetical protein DAI22_01g234500 [Oryza sativa Japonica Group]|nr:hypothetical protein DAI22_01g234500 [Oryza sativa Japonica Group]
MFPANWFQDRFKFTNSTREPISFGIWPDNLLLEKSRPTKYTSPLLYSSC